MTKQDVCDALNEGKTVTDVGQLGKQTKAALARAVKRGDVVRSMDQNFPNPKPCWRLA